MYRDNYWWPHTDDGYTSLIYLNKFWYPGSDLYSSVTPKKIIIVFEHSIHPWQSENYLLLKLKDCQ